MQRKALSLPAWTNTVCERLLDVAEELHADACDEVDCKVSFQELLDNLHSEASALAFVRHVIDQLTERGFTRADIATLLGVSFPAVTGWYEGHYRASGLHLYELIDLATHALGFTPVSNEVHRQSGFLAVMSRSKDLFSRAQTSPICGNDLRYSLITSTSANSSDVEVACKLIDAGFEVSAIGRNPDCRIPGQPFWVADRERSRTFAISREAFSLFRNAMENWTSSYLVANHIAETGPKRLQIALKDLPARTASNSPPDSVRLHTTIVNRLLVRSTRPSTRVSVRSRRMRSPRSGQRRRGRTG